MILKFLSVTLEGFQSISNECTISLDNQGIVAIKGVNLFDNKATSNGSGKCFGKDTKIQMYDGTIKNVQDIHVGDVVLGWDSTPRKVLETHKGVGTLYKIKHCVDDYSYICNANHILTLRTPVKNGSRYIFDMELSEYNTKPDWWKKQRNQFVMPMYYGKDEEFFIDPYTLGVWLGDGTKNEPQICNADIEVLNYWRSLATKYNLHLWEYQKPNNKALTVRLSQTERTKKANPFVAELKRLDVFNNKHIPKQYLLSSYNNRMKLLAGILDTDGFYDSSSHTYELAQVREDLTEDIIQLIRSLGFRVTRKIKIVNEKPYQRLYITGNHLHKIPTKVPHKTAKLISKQRADSISFDVEDYGYGEYYGFSIEGDGKFLLNTGLVVHNSSIMESINWCIYGKTSAGVSNVENKYYHDGCYVSVTLQKDSEVYTILRSLNHKKYKSTVTVTKNNDDGTQMDLSCRTKTETEKLIKSTIIPFSQDIFLSTIFLSQGFSGRLSLLSPSARKERLEILTNIESKVSEFKDKVAAQKTIYQNEYLENLKKISYTSGQLDTYSSEKTEIESYATEEEPVLPETDIIQLNQKSQLLNTKLSQISQDIQDNRISINKEETNLSYATKQLKSTEQETEKIALQANALQTSSECPTCHQKIENKELHSQLLNEYRSQYNALQEKCMEYHSTIKSSKSKLEDLNNTKNSLDNQFTTVQNILNKVDSVLRDYDTALKTNDLIKSKAARLNDCIQKISELSELLDTITTENTVTERNLAITDHMLKLITKEFRSYLLFTIIEKMNEVLRQYSSQLFEEDIINISTDNTKLDIKLTDTLYESLSGGEKKKVDLALVLAQRDIALKISGFTCNILILDEVLENLDEQASNVSLSLLNQIAEDVESIFIISHNNYNIPIDSTITVTKDSKRLSTISFT